ncbi:MAG: TMEM165/GDT1 family protein [Pseudonocardiales bacterium]|nr:TMEM165/GDT1 family protein [Pseudonocardiales bacterium]MBV9031389.1 TMEM165/GDT1 family protein [Pseudonocardiales bacterium]MBW0009598.1 TMEM165/GDT1 family protein [Pseudonocardiales bacterium]
MAVPGGAGDDGNPTVNLTLLAAVFGVIFVAELPDKTALASLVLGIRYRSGFVFLGVAAAFALHVIIAVAAGSALSLAPRRIVEAVVAVLFLAGAALMLRRGADGHDDRHASSCPPRRQVPDSVPAGDEPAPHSVAASLTRVRSRRAVRAAGFWKVVATSFGVLFAAEFGDLTQIATANLAAKYHDPLTVGAGAVLGLWAVGGLAILGGRQLLRWVPLTWVTRAAALVMTVLGVVSALHAITG